MNSVPAITIFDDGASRTYALVVDEGLGNANDKAAPLHEVQPITCFAKDRSQVLLGGAIGRRWGPCAELQQLWVHESHRCCGIGAALLRAFEERARLQGCSSVFLETFSFQAPRLYLAHGYQIAYENHLFPHGIVKFHLIKKLSGAEPPNQD